MYVSMTVSVHTCQAERFKTKLCAIKDDKAVSLIQPGCWVLHIALKVPRLLSWPDLLDLSNVNLGDRHTSDIQQLQNRKTVIPCTYRNVIIRAISFCLFTQFSFILSNLVTYMHTYSKVSSTVVSCNIKLQHTQKNIIIMNKSMVRQIQHVTTFLVINQKNCQ